MDISIYGHEHRSGGEHGTTGRYAGRHQEPIVPAGLFQHEEAISGIRSVLAGAIEISRHVGRKGGDAVAVHDRNESVGRFGQCGLGKSAASAE